MKKNPHYLEILKSEFGLNNPLCAAALGVRGTPTTVATFMSALTNGKIGTPRNVLSGAAMLFGQPESDAIEYHEGWLERCGAAAYKRNAPYDLLAENMLIWGYGSVIILPGQAVFNGYTTKALRIGIIAYTGFDEDSIPMLLESGPVKSEAERLLDGD